MRLLLAGLFSGALGLLQLVLLFAIESGGQKFPSALLVREPPVPLICVAAIDTKGSFNTQES